MDAATANQCAKWFEELYPSATVAQLAALRARLLPYEEAKFRWVAMEAVTVKSFVNDAIPYVMDRLRGETPPKRVRTWEDERNETAAAERAAALEQRKMDDHLIAAMGVEVIGSALSSVISSKDEGDPLRKLIEKHPDGRAARTVIAEWLRRNDQVPEALQSLP